VTVKKTVQPTARMFLGEVLLVVIEGCSCAGGDRCCHQDHGREGRDIGLQESLRVELSFVWIGAKSSVSLILCAFPSRVHEGSRRPEACNGGCTIFSIWCASDG
jgi:hypothetical protein